MEEPRDETESLLEFPCDFPVKIMGKDTEEFHREALELIERHVGKPDPEDVQRRRSSGGKFVALTIRFRAQSREQLDALYRELSAAEHILMVL